MKNIFKKIGGLCLGLAMLSGVAVGISSAGAEIALADGTSTFSTKETFTAPATIGDIQLSWDKGTYSSLPSVGSSYTKIYAGNTVTLTPLNGVSITEIKLTANSSSYIAKWSASDSTTLSISNNYATWTGNSSTAITLTNSNTAQGRINTFAVKYVGSSLPSLSAPLPSYNSGNLSWSAIEHATEYSVSIDNGDYISCSTHTSYGVSDLSVGNHYARVKAIGDKTNYLDSEPSKYASWTTTSYAKVPSQVNPFEVAVSAASESTTSTTNNFCVISGTNECFPFFVGFHRTTINTSYHEYVCEKTKGYVQIINLSNAKLNTLVIDNYSSNQFTVKMGNTEITGEPGTLTNNHLPVTYDLTQANGNEVMLYATGTTYDATFYSFTISFTTPYITSIEISGEPDKTTYYEGEELDPTGLTVTATYSDESTEEITTGIEWLFDPETLSTSTTSVDVIASVNEVVSESYTVNNISVSADSIDHIEISGTFKLSYTAGDEFDFSGIEVNKHMTSGNILPLSDYDLKIGDLEIEDGDCVYARYNNLTLSAIYETFVSSQTTTYTLNVADKAVMEWSDGGSVSYSVISDPSVLVSGDQILFTAPGVNYSQTMTGVEYTLTGDFGMGTQSDTTKSNIPAVSIKGNPLVYDNATAYTLVASNGHWMFKDPNNKYLSASGTSSNKLQVVNNADSTCEFDITVQSGNKMKIICSETKTTRNCMLFNCNLNTSTKKFSPMFNCYSYNSTNHTEEKGFYFPTIVKKNPASTPTNKAVYIKDAINTSFLNSKSLGSGGTYTVCNLIDSTDSRYSTAWAKIESIYTTLSAQDIEDLNVEEIYGNTGYTYAKVLCILLDGASKSIPSSLASVAGYPISSNIIFGFESESVTWIIVAVSLTGQTAIGGYFFYKKRKENI